MNKEILQEMSDTVASELKTIPIRVQICDDPEFLATDRIALYNGTDKCIDIHPDFNERVDFDGMFAILHVVYKNIWELPKLDKIFNLRAATDRHWQHPLAIELEKQLFNKETDFSKYKEGFPTWVRETVQRISDDLLPLFDNMPAVKVDLEYTHHSTDWTAPCGNYYPNNHRVVVRNNIIRSDYTLTQLLKHEMIHGWCYWLGHGGRVDPPMDYDHTNRTHNVTFHLKAFQIGENSTPFMASGDNAEFYSMLNYWLYHKDELGQYLTAEKLKDGKLPQLPTPKEGYIKAVKDYQDSLITKPYKKESLWGRLFG